MQHIVDPKSDFENIAIISKSSPVDDLWENDNFEAPSTVTLQDLLRHK